MKIKLTEFHARMAAFDKAIAKYARSAKQYSPAGYNFSKGG